MLGSQSDAARQRFIAGARQRAVLIALVPALAQLSACGGNSRSAESHPRSEPASATAQATTQSTPPAAATQPQRAKPSNAQLLSGGTVVVVDPGHNGANANALQTIDQLVPAGRGRMKACNTTGTGTDGGYPEASFNWDVAIRLKRLLSTGGARVVLTRSGNTGVGPCVNQRAAIGNAAHADAVIAIHADGAPAAGRGFSIIYAPDREETARTFAASMRLAHDVHEALLVSGTLPPSTYEGHDGYSLRDDLAGLNLSTQPAIFVELGNMRNSTDAEIQTDAARRQQLAEALASGLAAFLTSSR